MAIYSLLDPRVSITGLHDTFTYAHRVRTMDYVYTVFNNFKYFYTSMNPATLSGAIDVVVVEQPDGTYLSTPFHIRFGKWAVFSISHDGKQSIDVEVNEELVEGLRMEIGEEGIVCFDSCSSERLKLFRLKYGANEARFSVTTKFQGTASCLCQIYLLKWCERIVISDIDGTITRSDVLGHVIPAIGGTWAHAGVAELYTRIKNNGYRIIYLSSRAIGQSQYTKSYLRRIAQGTQMLPEGPVLLSPTSVLMAFRTEVIDRKPEVFKIACLNDLRRLFPVKHPFYAGFGNRETDVKSYSAVDVPHERILIINPQGVIIRADKGGYTCSYTSMAAETVDYLFPPLKRPEFTKADDAGEGACTHLSRQKMRTNFAKPEHSNFTHWRFKSPDDTVNLDTYEKRRKEMQESGKSNKK